MGQVTGVNSKTTSPIDKGLFRKCSFKEVAITLLALAALASIVLGTVWLCKPSISLLPTDPLMGMIIGGGGVLLILSLAIYFSRKQTQTQSKGQTSIPNAVTGKGGVSAPEPSLFPALDKIPFVSDRTADALARELGDQEYFLHKNANEKIVYWNKARQVVYFHENGDICGASFPIPPTLKHERDVLRLVQQQNYKSVSLEILEGRKLLKQAASQVPPQTAAAPMAAQVVSSDGGAPIAASSSVSDRSFSSNEKPRTQPQMSARARMLDPDPS